MEANPMLGPSLLSKVDLANAYMRIWVKLKKHSLRSLPYSKVTKGGRVARGITPIYPNGICGISAFLLCSNGNS